MPTKRRWSTNTASGGLKQDYHQNRCSNYINFVRLMRNIIVLAIDIHEEMKACLDTQINDFNERN